MSVSVHMRRPPDWTQDASCQGKADGGSDPWHDPARYDEALAVCRACPVRSQCETDGLGLLQVLQVEGIWGGLTPRELRARARELGLPARLVAQCGTRSGYIAGCRCRRCTFENTFYENERRVGRRPASSAA